MKAKRYKIKICVDITHGWHSTIDEIYIPDFAIVINKESVFKEKHPGERMSKSKNIQDIEINDDIVKMASECAGFRDKFEDLQKETIMYTFDFIANKYLPSLPKWEDIGPDGKTKDNRDEKR